LAFPARWPLMPNRLSGRDRSPAAHHFSLQEAASCSVSRPRRSPVSSRGTCPRATRLVEEAALISRTNAMAAAQGARRRGLVLKHLSGPRLALPHSYTARGWAITLCFSSTSSEGGRGLLLGDNRPSTDQTRRLMSHRTAFGLTGRPRVGAPLARWPYSTVFWRSRSRMAHAAGGEVQRRSHGCVVQHEKA
jgi:hypothetical protein